MVGDRLGVLYTQVYRSGSFSCYITLYYYSNLDQFVKVVTLTNKCKCNNNFILYSNNNYRVLTIFNMKHGAKFWQKSSHL